MCQERAFYKCQIMKEIPGTSNFAIALECPGQFNAADINMPE